ncbi:MAG: hypothetical protein ABIS01_04285, partial [Ferruginibacter sp.]
MPFTTNLSCINPLKCSLIFLLVWGTACNTSTKKTDATPTLAKGTYAYDAAFLKKHTKTVIELMSGDSAAKVLISADYQG